MKDNILSFLKHLTEKVKPILHKGAHHGAHHALRPFANVALPFQTTVLETKEFCLSKLLLKRVLYLLTPLIPPAFAVDCFQLEPMQSLSYATVFAQSINH